MCLKNCKTSILWKKHIYTFKVDKYWNLQILNKSKIDVNFNIKGFCHVFHKNRYLVTFGDGGSHDIFILKVLFTRQYIYKLLRSTSK